MSPSPIESLTAALAPCLSCLPLSSLSSIPFLPFTTSASAASSPTSLTLHDRRLKILRLLGEGGFSYVYLAQDARSGALYALKKIRCPFGAESVARARAEVQAHRRFARVPGVMDIVDYLIVGDDTAADDDDGGGGGAGMRAIVAGGGGSEKVVYILLPYYPLGTLQDRLNAYLVEESNAAAATGARGSSRGRKPFRPAIPQREAVRLIRGVCVALQGMHEYEGCEEDEEEQPQQDEMVVPGSAAARRSKQARAKAPSKAQRRPDNNNEDDDDADAQPLMGTNSHPTPAPSAKKKNKSPSTTTTTQGYAHRDIKPGNIMLALPPTSFLASPTTPPPLSSLIPILMDLGSVAPAPLPITTRRLATAVQEQAAEHSTLPYRAPELLDVHVGSVVGAPADVWSLGCVLYALLVGRSPFERRSDETGGSLALCVLGGDWRFPDEMGEDEVCAGVRGLVGRCLRVEPEERPRVGEVVDICDGILAGLGEEDEED